MKNVSNSGLDGAIINTKGLDNYKIAFDKMPNLVERAGVIKETSLSINDIGQVITDMESYTWFNKKSNKVKFGYNAKYLPERFKLVGRLDKDIVFDFDNSELDYGEMGDDGDVQYCLGTALAIATLVVAAVALGFEVYNTVKKSKQKHVTKHYDAKGNYTGQSVTYTTDPEPFEIELKGKIYKITDISIEIEETLPKALVGNPSALYYPLGEQITCYNIPYFDIISIEK